MAAGYLDDNELKQEAEAAVIKIAEATIKEHPSVRQNKRIVAEGHRRHHQRFRAGTGAAIA